MAVGFDSQSFKDLTTTGGTWTHTPVGTPRGMGALIACQGSTCDVILSVTWGGATLTRLAFATCGGGEPGNVYAYYKGTAVAASGTMNVVCSSATVSNRYTAWAFAVTANQAWTEIAGTATLNAGSVANPSATIHALSGDSGVALGVLFSGQNVPTSVTANAGYTIFAGSTTGGRDFGTQTAVAIYSTAYKSGATVSVGWTQSTDDAAGVGIFVREVPPTVLPPTVNAPLTVV